LEKLARELEIALAAVRAAARICVAVQRDLVAARSLEKKDKSPVTVADFASQAVVCAALQRDFPADLVVGEESAADLHGAGAAGLRAQVTEFVRAAVDDSVDEARVLGWIDRGGGDARAERFWTLDPIDGTKGFLRGEQYAVALALIEAGEVVLGVLGCPNLPADGSTGGVFAARRGGAAFAMPLAGEGSAGGRAIRVSGVRRAAEARFCESVESGHSDQDEAAEIARRLGIRSAPYRIDSQCKYAVVARSDASIYLRLPTRAEYQEKIWDHAAGKLIVECAGGTVTDVEGRPLDFSRGRTLETNKGVVATGGRIHAEVLRAVRAVREISA
jgi:3'(2'), 5'-bisphosphate nucleotidase